MYSAVITAASGGGDTKYLGGGERSVERGAGKRRAGQARSRGP